MTSFVRRSSSGCELNFVAQLNWSEAEKQPLVEALAETLRLHP